jgi:ectoine hydroxylase-related dioxygenase (phytanoyl-CoA dioxygenase family)
MLRSPLADRCKPLSFHTPSDRLPIEYFDFSNRLGQHAFYQDFREECAFLHRNGYVVLRDVVDQNICNELRSQYDRILTGNFSGEDLYCEFFDSRGTHHYGVEYDFQVADTSNRKFKILDMYASSRLALEAALSPVLERFLSLIFNSEILAFQQLGFLYGTEQPIHQDTAYVRVSKPAMLAASWIALEDIEEGTGELEFIPGSHKFDRFRFDSSDDQWCQEVESDPSSSIWWNNSDLRQHAKFLDSLQSLKKAYGHDKFLPRKGDALIWISYFAHGGSAIKWDCPSKATRTRKSLVTHYCPYPVVFPMYMREVVHEAPKRYSDYASYVSKSYPPRGIPCDFDPELYLQFHKDVALNQRYSSDPAIHYTEVGLAEGRRYK